MGLLQIPYAALGPNSNSAVASTLRKCSLPVKKPAGWAPGWLLDNLLEGSYRYGGKSASVSVPL